MVSQAVFGVWDYVTFILFLLISAMIGVYFACTGKKQSTNTELLLGDRNMSIIPVALSLVASFISAISITGIPSEWYYRGIQFVFVYIGAVLCLIITAHLFLPKYYSSDILSIHKFLELRFRHKLPRYLGSLIFSLQTILYMSIVLYTPALAINVVTSIPIWACILLVGGICTFYTSIGGLKAVIWTDVFQSLVMYAALFTIVVWGSLQIGGFGKVWKIAKEKGRLSESFKYSWNPTEFQTVPLLIMHGIFYWAGAYASSQVAIQRYLSLPTLRKAQLALYMNIPGLFIIVFLCGLSGLVIFANYADCDPLANHDIERKDQIVPYFVIDKLGQFPGVSGIFVATLFSGSLSTISSGVNSMSAIMWDDYIKFCIKPRSEQFAANVTRALAVLFGVIAIGTSFLVANLRGIIQTTLTLVGAAGGPLLGLFSLALFFPSANWIGASIGTLSSLAIITWMSIGQLLSIDLVYAPYLQTSTSECELITTDTFTETSTLQTTTMAFNSTTDTGELTPLQTFYKITFLLYPVLGCLLVVVIGVVTSAIAEFICGSEKLPWGDAKYSYYWWSDCCTRRREEEPMVDRKKVKNKNGYPASQSINMHSSDNNQLHYANPSFLYESQDMSNINNRQRRYSDQSWVLGTSV